MAKTPSLSLNIYVEATKVHARCRPSRWFASAHKRFTPAPSQQLRCEPSSLLSALDPVEPLNRAGQVGHVGYGGEFAGRVHGEQADANVHGPHA